MMESAAKLATEQAREQGGRMKAELGGVVVLDFGGQYTQLIARRIREQQVFSAVLPCTSSIEEIRKFAPAGIVLSGGPSSVYDSEAPKCAPVAETLARNRPRTGNSRRVASSHLTCAVFEKMTPAEFADFWANSDGPPLDVLRSLEALFNDVSLSPWTELTEKVRAFLWALRGASSCG